MYPNQVFLFHTLSYYLTLFHRRIRSVIRVRHRWRVLVNIKDYGSLAIKVLATLEYLDLRNKIGVAKLSLMLEKKATSAQAVWRTWKTPE